MQHLLNSKHVDEIRRQERERERGRRERVFLWTWHLLNSKHVDGIRRHVSK
jgi:hypothetical protein